MTKIPIICLRPGDRVVGAFRGEPTTREAVWNGIRYATFNPILHPNQDAVLRFMLNFFDPAEEVMKVFEGPASWFKEVYRAREEHGLDDWLFEVQRIGSREDQARYQVSPHQQISPSQRASMEAAPLHDLEDLAKQI